MIADDPVDAGAVKLIVALPSPAVAVPIVGAPGAEDVDTLVPELLDDPPPPHPARASMDRTARACGVKRARLRYSTVFLQTFADRASAVFSLGRECGENVGLQRTLRAS